MHSSKTKPFSGDDPPAISMTELPNDLIIEILTWLPGRRLCQCKCVCKRWRSITRSRPFLETYRKRQRGLLLYWSEERRLRFFHCPFRRLQERWEEFHPLCELDMGSRILHGVSQLVNGLLCVSEYILSPQGTDYQLITLNICTGETMRVPNPLPCVFTNSTYHLGYDPVSRMYKLLRLIYGEYDGLIQGAHIMTLGPLSGPWRKLDNNAAGICDLHSIRKCRDNLSSVRSSTNDSLLCWMGGGGGLVCFDLNMERFRHIEYPQEIKDRTGRMRLLGITVFKDRLALWVSFRKDGFNRISCYVQEDDEGKNWSEQCVEKSRELRISTRTVFAADNIMSSPSNGKILVMNHDQPRRVYSYSHPQTEQPDKEDVFFVGNLPEDTPPLALSGLFCSCSYTQAQTTTDGSGKLCCFVEGNNLYLPLDDIFGGASVD